MNDDVLFERLASHDGPAAMDGAFEDRLYSILQQEVRRGRSLRPALLLAATLVAVLTITAAIAVGSGLIKPPWSDRSLIPTPMPTTVPFVYGWPGARENPPGRYSWGSRDNPGVGRYAWIHNGYQTLDEGQSVSITFAFQGDADESGPVAVTVGSYEGTYEELTFESDGRRTLLWILDIEGKRVRITVEAEPNTTRAQLAEVHTIIGSIRYEPTETDGYRLIFTLTAGWDSG